MFRYKIIEIEDLYVIKNILNSGRLINLFEIHKLHDKFLITVPYPLTKIKKQKKKLNLSIQTHYLITIIVEHIFSTLCKSMYIFLLCFGFSFSIDCGVSSIACACSSTGSAAYPNSFTLVGSTLYIHLWYKNMKNTTSKKKKRNNNIYSMTFIFVERKTARVHLKNRNLMIHYNGKDMTYYSFLLKFYLPSLKQPKRHHSPRKMCHRLELIVNEQLWSHCNETCKIPKNTILCVLHIPVNKLHMQQEEEIEPMITNPTKQLMRMIVFVSLSNTYNNTTIDWNTLKITARTDKPSKDLPNNSKTLCNIDTMIVAAKIYGEVSNNASFNES
ncbi:hypothetical protein AGLY_001261 [Aphis glycines]|uniref:Uncharacterized protein n=1 Tax=Aphis glycines TaxID=307491 RepID=A0A6G0U9B1_APHGL|nr:hypothetical protein AGLY_001261 [Aphis glycines]